jgi:precorrin-3B methylase
MPETLTAPRSATEAAHQLAQAGHHVHIVSEGHSTCLKGTYGPAPIELPTATRARAHAVRLSLAVGVHRL